MEAGPAPQDVAEIAHRRASATAVKFVPPPQTPPKPSGSPLAAGDPARPETRTLRTRDLAATSEDLVRQQPLQACKIVQKALPNLILKLHAGNHSESAGRSPAKLLWGTGRASIPRRPIPSGPPPPGGTFPTRRQIAPNRPEKSTKIFFQTLYFSKGSSLSGNCCLRMANIDKYSHLLQESFNSRFGITIA